MTADEVKKWLYDGKDGKPDEVDIYEMCNPPKLEGYDDPEMKAILESLAACRKMLKKHEHKGYNRVSRGMCPECQQYPPNHMPDCVLASLVAGLPREEDIPSDFKIDRWRRDGLPREGGEDGK